MANNPIDMKNYIPHVLGVIFVLCIMGGWALVAKIAKKNHPAAEPAAVVSQPAEPQPLAGGYGEYRDLIDEEQAFFESVYQGEVALTPKQVATQVVAGTNYRFLCESAEGVTYRVTIFVPLPCYQDTQTTHVTEVVLCQE